MIELLTSEYRGLIQDFLAFTVCFAALVWGGGPERAVALTWLVVFELAGRLFRSAFDTGPKLTDVDFFFASADVMAGVIWIAIALYANRNYPLWIAGLQVLVMTAHLARGIAEAISPIGYVIMVVAPGWFQLIFLGIGLSRHILRKRQFGPYRDWRPGVGKEGWLHTLSTFGQKA